MNLVSVLFSRVLDVLDASFDAVASLSRVALRGAFAPDAKGYRSRRFVVLDPTQVLIQEIALNAGDASEARKAVALDPERVLPLDATEIVFDVAGPIGDLTRTRTRPEHSFLLGIARKEALAQARETSGRKGAIEAFLFMPPQYSELALKFGDEIGAKRRRFRRAVSAVALILFTAVFTDTSHTFDATLERRMAQVDAERIALQHRIRVAERRVEQAETAKTALLQSRGPALTEVTARLGRLSAQLPPDAELSTVTIEPRDIILTGRSYAPEAAELALRRAFEGATITFETIQGDAPQAFSARLSEQEAPSQ